MRVKFDSFYCLVAEKDNYDSPYLTELGASNMLVVGQLKSIIRKLTDKFTTDDQIFTKRPNKGKFAQVVPT